MSLTTRTTSLSLAIFAALSLADVAQARELGNFDINSAALKKSAAAVGAAQPTVGDALGRETFTWLQQELPAATKAAARDPETAARAHLAQLLTNAKRATETTQILTRAKVDTQRGGATLVQFQPRLDGIEIFHESVALLMDKDQRLVAMRGPLPRNAPSSAKSMPAFKLDAAQAIAAALGAYDFEAKAASKLVATKTAGDYQWFRLAGAVQSKSGAVAYDEQRAKRVYFRTRAGLQPAWYVETRVADGADTSADSYAHVISALDGSVLFRVNLTSHAAPAYSYRVWAEPAPAGQPHPTPMGRATTPDPDGLPTHNSVPLIPQALVTLANTPFSRAATDGWLPAGATVTSGNNVNAYADLVAPDGFGPGDLQPSATSANSFDYVFSPSLKPSATPTQKQAATVHMFYHLNWLHDWFYDHGFTEADGNAQLDNYGRGGLGGDPILAEAQDYDVEDNANMATPADGGSPVTQMGLSSRDPETDRTINGRTLSHEWGHYLSNRLIGDSAGLFTEHAGGLGEGWGDIVALLTTAKEEDKLKPGNAAFNGAYGGGYADHSYYGVRRYPFSTDLSKNPLSLRYIVDGVPLPAPAPAFGASGVDNTEVHSQGEIWASALWDGYVGMLNDSSRLNFTEAQRRMKDYLVASLKLTPIAPTMIEARDAVLATIHANGQPQDYALFAAAFAKRGLGAGAHIPDRYSSTMAGTVESMNGGGDITVASVSLGVPTGCDADTALDPGESTKLNVTVVNTGFTALSGATATIVSDNPALSFPSGTTLQVGDLPLYGRREFSVPVLLNSGIATNTPIAITVTPDAPGIALPPGTPAATTAFVGFDELLRSSPVENFEGTYPGWRNERDPVGSGRGFWSRRGEGSIKFLHGADTGSETVAWIETPVLSVGSDPLSVTLKHRYSFEIDGGTFFDGGVVQASTDGGNTWSDVDIGVIGAVLSDCCGNPFAGRRAFIGQNATYPAFVNQTLNLGTTYAGQSNFRMRFGVATDQSVSREGWDIDSVAFSGLTDTPFATVVPQAASCSIANGKSLQGAMSGAYYLPSRSGEGVLVDFGQVGSTPVVFFSWYTYESGRQQWLVGNNTFALSDKSVTLDLIEPVGANFGNAFRAEDVVRQPWGSASLSFPSCDTMVLTYQRADGEAGSITMNRGLERLPAGQCNTLHGGLSGAFYSRQRSGEGVLMDFGKVGATPVEFFSWYTYDQGKQKWLVGNNTFSASDGSLSLDLIETSGTGFGNAFRSSEVVRTPWGRVTQRFTDCDTLELSYQKTGGESGTIVMTRGLQRLGDGQCH